MQEQPGRPRKTNRQRFSGPVPPGRPVASGQFPPGQAQPVQQPSAPPSVEVLTAEFEALVANNQAKFAELSALGTAPDPLYLVHARINSLIESIASFAGPQGPVWAMLARVKFERQIAAELEQAGPAARRMQLAEGARYSPEMIRALAAQTGTLGRRA